MRPASGVAALITAVLLTPASAIAWRRPTPSERSELTEAARPYIESFNRSASEPDLLEGLTEIRISTIDESRASAHALATAYSPYIFFLRVSPEPWRVTAGSTECLLPRMLHMPANIATELGACTWSRDGSEGEIELRTHAEELAQRTFVYEGNFGGHGRHKRHFGIRGRPAFTVKAPDGSLLTAFQASVDSADGTGDIVLLFDESRFVGWTSNRMAGGLTLGRRGHAILVRYWHYRGRNATCCPSGKVPVTYRWNGHQIVASGKPPLIYGKPGPKLHFGALE